MNSAARNFGDMPADEFRRLGQQFVEWAAAFLQNIDDVPVLSDVKPGEIRKNLPPAAPENGESLQDALGDLDRLIVPGMTHWNHPNFFAYFCSSGSFPGILAELVSAALNNNGMLWKSCPASTELEQVTLGWLRQMLGLPEEFWGIIYDTGSVSSLHALAAARENLSEYRIREEGMAGRSDLPRLRLYQSEHAHSSIDKAAVALGIGLAGIRKIPVDAEFRMQPKALRQAIAEDRKNGWRPFCVVATLGTTSVASLDPVADIADICEQEDLWLHVDAAYAGSAAVIPEMRPHFSGWQRADSVLVNPHKWLFVPIDLSAFYTRKPEVLKRAFSLVPEYLRTDADSEVENYMDYGIPLGRRFRSLKLWFVLRYFGQTGIAERLRYHIQLAQKFSSWVDVEPDFERIAPVHFGLVCFRFHPENVDDENELNQLNEKLLAEINATREIFLSHTKIDGKFILRFAIGNLRTEQRHVERAWEIIKDKSRELNTRF